MTTARFRKHVRWLRKNFPIGAPVSVKRYPAKKNHGVTGFDGRQFRIRLNSNSDDPGLLDTLIHEWAHAYIIDQSFSHNGGWGVEYAKIYTAHTNAEI